MPLSCDHVRSMAASGRIRPGAGYHARSHAVRWETLIAACTGCYSVAPDHRTNPDGSPKHPNGYVVLCRHRTAGGRYRIDADLLKDASGRDVLFVATGFPI